MPDTTNLATALIKAKRNFKPIVKNKTNPYHKSKYASLDSVIDAITESLGAEGLVLLQPIEFDGDRTILNTVIIHAETGEKIQSQIAFGNQPDPQKLGSLLTYYRRFSICSLLAIVADDDDDGNSNMQTKTQQKTNQATTQAQSVTKKPPDKPDIAPLPPTDRTDRLKELKVAVVDKIAALGWSKEEQYRWGNGLHGKPSTEWSLQEWSMASVDLQERIDKEAAGVGIEEPEDF